MFRVQIPGELFDSLLLEYCRVDGVPSIWAEGGISSVERWLSSRLNVSEVKFDKSQHRLVESFFVICRDDADAVMVKLKLA